MLAPQQIGRILDCVYRNFSIAADAEVTLEVNPGTVSRGNLKDYRSIGINRLNIGLQSICDNTLLFLGRIHSARQGVDTYNWSREVGFENVGLDLMYAIPDRNRSHWEAELTDVIRMEPEHLSCYSLTIEAGTPIADRVDKGEIHPLDEKTAGDLFSLTNACLNSNNYDQYEISNFARRTAVVGIDRRSRHNRKYWNLAPYLGFGPAAHSYQQNERWWNHRSLDRYLSDLKMQKMPVADREILNRDQQIIEFIYLGLRQTDGIDTKAFALRFGTGLYDMFGPVLESLSNEKLVESYPGRIRLTERGMRFHESVIGRVLC